MSEFMAGSALAWLLTYAVHSTLLLGLAWAISQRAKLSVVTRDFMWKVALVGGIVTSIVQTQLNVRPSGSFALASQEISIIPANQSAVDKSIGAGAGENENQAIPENAQSKSTQSNPLPTNESTADSGVASGFSLSAFIANFDVQLSLVIAWAALAFVLAAFYLGRRLILVGRLANRQTVREGPLPAMLDALCREVGYRTSVTLTSVNTISSPVALGFHEICLPDAALTQLEPDQQRGLLAHELAHIVRRDPMWLYTASLLERVFFFQPLNRLARKELQRNAEYLCDDWAAARTGSGLPLAHCLVRVAEWIEASPLGVPVAGMAEQRSLLVTRVARLIDGKRSNSPMSRLAFGALAIVFLTGITAAAPGVHPNGTPVTPTTTNYWSSLTSQKSLTGAETPASRLSPAGMAADLPNALRSAPPSPSTDTETDSTSNDSEANIEAHKQNSENQSAAAAQDPAVITALIERLKDTDAGVRIAAANSLGNLKSRRAVGPLIEVLADRNKQVRVAAIQALEQLEDPAAVSALVRLINDESPDVREHVLSALANFTEALTVAQVLPALRDARPSLRAKAAEVLGNMEDNAAVGPLVKVLADASPEVRHEALHALEHLQDRSAVPAILPLLRDENAEVRGAAVSAIRELKGTIPERDVVSLLEDPNAEVRQSTIDYVKDNPSSTLLPVLRRLLEDQDGDVRESAVEALSEIRDPLARTILREALRSGDPKVRKRAAEALGNRP